ncbi:energy-coupling factor transporter transmembrane component T family protein [Sediminivirga luteola]|uniref:energy-coupling factor transporter transmembrane component T family protein n=1 Tax=Sediminivirga luteola TaxID=1774748 RepID=UPI001F589D1D|nr:energy-coupling factor transporter transmembrane protein EcfT [Sediminivirga luteola]
MLLACAMLLVYGVASPLMPAAVLLLSAAAALCSPRVRLRSWLLGMLVLAGPMLLVVGVVQGLFYPGPAEVLWSWGPARLTAEGAAVAAQLWLRVAAMVSVCLVFALSADAGRVFDALIVLRLPLGLAYVCAAAVGMVPRLRQRLGDTLAARAARGHDTGRLGVRLRLLGGIAAGLLLSSLTDLDQRHDALVQRGFGTARRPAPWRRYPYGRLQRTLRWALPALSLAVVAASIGGWLPLPAASDLIPALAAGSEHP